MTRPEDFYRGPAPLDERTKATARRGLARARQALKHRTDPDPPSPRSSPLPPKVSRDAGGGDEQQDAPDETPNAEDA